MTARPPEEPTIGVLLMAYGAVESVDDLEAYYTDIRHGRTPSPEALADLRERYETIGGSSPLREITFRQAEALQDRLRGAGDRSYRVFVGMRHWHPFIDEVVAGQIADSGIETLVTVVLAPHYSRMSIGAYYRRLDEALDQLENPPRVLRVKHYHQHPAFVADIAGAVADGLRQFVGAAHDPETALETARERVKVLYTAHSLPARILETGDPYKDQLLESCRRVAETLGGLDWDFAFQSAADTGVPWLGPDILEVLPRLAVQGHQRVLVVPIGFICDHLEILYDIDVECARVARQHGIELRRTRMPNDRASFIAALEAIVRDRLARGSPQEGAESRTADRRGHDAIETPTARETSRVEPDG